MITHPTTVRGFRHEVLFYGNRDEYLGALVPFLHDGLAAGQPVLVATSSEHISWLRAEIGGETPVLFADMAELGRNPARIIPAWRRFLDRYGGRDVAARGVGEPIWSGRSPAELVECQLHESLLNLAFADARQFTLFCPYDVATLDDAVVAEALRSHPVVHRGGMSGVSSDYLDVSDAFAGALPPPAARSLRFPFEAPTDLERLRLHMAAVADRHGLTESRRDDLVLAVNEMAANCLHHGGGRGVLETWIDGDVVICELRDEGVLAADPLLGRVEPLLGREGGRGMWLANQVADLVQVRRSSAGTTVRIHVSRL